jgi:LytR cell envelope-related transcriptional attenuator
VGRRSSPNQWPFYRSVLSWFVPWALVAVIVGIGVWIAVDALSGGASNGRSSAALAGGRSPSASVHQSPKGSPGPTPSASLSHNKKPKPPLITKGITVQVLDATSDLAAGQRMATRLAHLGFKIAVVGGAASSYDRTTVYWAYPSAKPAAKALAAHFGWVAAPKPANLSPQVALHVVVGADAL